MLQMGHDATLCPHQRMLSLTEQDEDADNQGNNKIGGCCKTRFLYEIIAVESFVVAGALAEISPLVGESVNAAAPVVARVPQFTLVYVDAVVVGEDGAFRTANSFQG